MALPLKYEVYIMRRFRFKKSYYKNIIIILLIVTLVPVVLLGGSIISLVMRQEEVIYQSQETMVEKQQNQIEQIFMFIETEMIQIALKNEAVSTLYLDRKAKYFEKFNSIGNELQLIDGFGLLDEVLFVSYKNDWVMSLTNFTNIAQSEFKDTISKLSSLNGYSNWYADQSYLYLAKKLPINSKDDIGMIVVRYDKKLIQDYFSDRTGYSTVILDDKNNIIFGDKKSNLIIDYLLSSDDKTEDLTTNNILNIPYHNKSYVLASSKSDYYGWNYILIASDTAIKQQLYQIFLILFILTCCLMIIIVISIIIGSRKLYSPINNIGKIIDKNAEKEDFTDLDSDNEANLVMKVQHIMNKNNEMRKKISSSKKESKQLFLINAYQGTNINLTKQELINNGIVSVNLDEYYMNVLLIKNNTSNNNKEDQLLYMFALENIVSELLDKRNIFPIVINDNILYITMYQTIQSEASLNVILQTISVMIITTIKKYLNCVVSIGVSQSFSDISGLGNAVEEARKALRDTIGTNNKYSFYNQPRLSNASFSDSMIRQQRMLVIQMIEQGDEEKCYLELDEFFNILQEIEYYIFKLEINKLISEILDYYENYALTPNKDIVSDILDFDINKIINSYEKVKHYIKDYLLIPLFTRICEPIENTKIILRFIQYLNDNIEENINLEDFAMHFNYNPNYLSRMFKKYFGKNYTDYVTEKRVERCKELLLTTDISINDLSEKFNYQYTQNFIRIFKKYTLMTPGQFREVNKVKEKRSLSND